MKEFIFKLFRLEWEEKRCEYCEHYRLLIEQERSEKNRLLSLLVDKTWPNQTEAVPSSPVNPVPLNKYTPFSVIKQRLEKEDRLAHQRNQEAEKKNAVEILEKEVLENADKISSANANDGSNQGREEELKKEA